MDLRDKVAVLTAAGAGIGRAAALEFAKRGAKVLVSDRDGDAAHAVAAELQALGAEALGWACDVASDTSVADLAKTAFERFDRVDILMNHAGASASGPPNLIPLEDWRWVFDINILGVARALHAFLPRMIDQGEGLIINTSSGLAVFPEVPFSLPYITTKAGLTGLSEALALYLKPLNIRVMILYPDITRTGFHYTARRTAIQNENKAAMLPLSQEQSPEDVAAELMRAIDAGQFIACNIPDFDQHLIAKASDRNEPRFRVYAQVQQAVEQRVRDTHLQS